MGEAQRRKASDPLFGKVPKTRPDRGIVVSPPMKIDGSVVHFSQTWLDQRELRFWLLYWDKLVWPSSRAICLASGPDEDFLSGEGILMRPDYTYGGDGAQGLLKAQLQAFAEREDKEPGLWAIAQGERCLQAVVPDQVGRGILVNLHQALPILDTNVPLQEILEFKAKRLPELYQLRMALDALYFEIERASDKSLAMIAATSKIDTACRDLIRASQELKFPKLIATLNFSVSVPVGALAHLAGAPTDLALIAGTLAGIAPQLSLDLGSFGWKGRGGSGNPYRYAITAAEELVF